MKKKVKKWVAVFLALSLCFSYTACTKQEEGTETSVQDAENNKKAEGSQTAKKVYDDLDGMNIRIADWYAIDTEDTTDYQKDTTKYREEIMEKYNFKIERVRGYAFQDIQETYVTQVMSKATEWDLYYMYQETVAQPLLKGLMYNLNDLKTLDLREEKWNKTVNDLMTFGNAQYGMSAENEPRGGIFFNKRLFEEAGIDPEEVYDLQRDGQWTWEKFEEYCEKLTKDTDNDGKIDQYAIASFSKIFLPAAAASNNAGFIGKDKSGKYQNIMGSNEFFEAMDWAMKIVDKYTMPKPDGAAWDWYKAAFRDCEVAMQTSEAYETGSFVNMEDEWGFVLFPYNQENADATNKTIPNDNIVCIPSCFDHEKAEKIAFAYDLYTEMTPEYDEEDVYREGYYNKFKDSRAVDETLMMMQEDKYKYVSYLPMVSIDVGDYCYSVYAGGATPAQQYEKLKSSWDKKVDDMNKKYDNFSVENEN